jgi:hypothetical protein
MYMHMCCSAPCCTCHQSCFKPRIDPAFIACHMHQTYVTDENQNSYFPSAQQLADSPLHTYKHILLCAAGVPQLTLSTFQLRSRASAATVAASAMFSLNIAAMGGCGGFTAIGPCGI